MKSFSPQSSGMLKNFRRRCQNFLEIFKSLQKIQIWDVGPKFKYLAKLSKCSAKHRNNIHIKYNFVTLKISHLCEKNSQPLLIRHPPHPHRCWVFTINLSPLSCSFVPFSLFSLFVFFWFFPCFLSSFLALDVPSQDRIGVTQPVTAKSCLS